VAPRAFFFFSKSFFGRRLVFCLSLPLCVAVFLVHWNAELAFFPSDTFSVSPRLPSWTIFAIFSRPVDPPPFFSKSMAESFALFLRPFSQGRFFLKPRGDYFWSHPPIDFLVHDCESVSSLLLLEPPPLFFAISCFVTHFVPSPEALTLSPLRQSVGEFSVVVRATRWRLSLWTKVSFFLFRDRRLSSRLIPAVFTFFLIMMLAGRLCSH